LTNIRTKSSKCTEIGSLKNKLALLNTCYELRCSIHAWSRIIKVIDVAELAGIVIACKSVREIAKWRDKGERDKGDREG
jgi:hypothetical protein